MQKRYSAVYGQSNFDVCLNTYGSLDFLIKMLQDSGVDNVNSPPESGQEFIYDDSLVVTQGINQNFSLKGIRYATDIGQKGSVYYIIQQNKPPGYSVPALDPGTPITNNMYSQTNGTSYTSNADGTTIIVPTDKDGNSMVGMDIIQIEKEIKPFVNAQWNWNKATGILTLLGGTTVDNGETLFIIYSKIITG